MLVCFARASLVVQHLYDSKKCDTKVGVTDCYCCINYAPFPWCSKAVSASREVVQAKPAYGSDASAKQGRPRSKLYHFQLVE